MKIQDVKFNTDDEYLYHISSLENKNDIMSVGLDCNDEGCIFLFEDVTVETFLGETNVMEHIAKNQLRLKDVAMFAVKKSDITGEIINDDVGEITAPFQWIIKQKNIPAYYVDDFSFD